MKPLFVHDCDKCKYLGSLYVPLHNTMADVYKSCGKDMEAIIFRYSDEGPDYSHHHIEFTNMGYLFKTPKE